jgi:hypothetical protein
VSGLDLIAFTEAMYLLLWSAFAVFLENNYDQRLMQELNI